MLPLAPVSFPLTRPAVRPRGISGSSVVHDETASLKRMEKELERQVRICKFPVVHGRNTLIGPPLTPTPSSLAALFDP